MPRSHSEYEFNDNMKRLTLDVSDITYLIKSESVYCICATSEKMIMIQFQKFQEKESLRLDSSSIKLINVTFTASGVFRCEINIRNPNETATKNSSMVVVGRKIDSNQMKKYSF